MVVLTAVAAALLAAGLLLLPPSGTDLAAQQARASFAAHHPGSAVDLRWYGGVLPAAYSVMAPYVLAFVGVRPAGALAVAAAAVLLAVLLVRWRVRRPLLASLWGAVALAGNVVSGRTTFAVGVAFALAALVTVPEPAAGRRRWVAPVGLAVLTALASPVAAVFLGLVCAAAAVRRRALLLPAVAAGVPLLAVAALFPQPGRMPFAWHVAWPVLLATLAVAVLCRAPVVRVAAAIYAGAVLVVFVAPGPVGSNVERLALLFAGAAVLACARVRRGWLVPVLAVLAWWTLLVPVRDLRAVPAVSEEHAAARRLVSILSGLGPATGRVEVVPLLDHGESAVVADAWPLARGWERHVDVERAPLFYRGTLSPDRYRRWLLAQAVQYVALAPRLRLDWSAGTEAGLLAHPPAWLQTVHRDAQWTVWRVAGARPVAAPAVVTGLAPDRVELRVSRAGTVAVAMHWSRWLVVSGDACLRRSGDAVAVVVARPGPVTISSSYTALWHSSGCRSG